MAALKLKKYHIKYTKDNGEKKIETWSAIPKGVYYAEGYQDRKDKGKAYLQRHTKNGSALIPLIVTKTKKQFKKK